MSKKVNSKKPKAVNQSQNENKPKVKTPDVNEPFQLDPTPRYHALIEKLVAALDRNTQALQNAIRASVPVVNGHAIETKSYLPEIAQMELPVGAAATPVVPEPKPEPVKLDKSQVLKAMQAVHAKDQRLAETVLAKFGATRLTEIKESQFAAVVEACQQALN